MQERSRPWELNPMVYVRSYYRVRFGKVELVRDHQRHYPSR